MRDYNVCYKSGAITGCFLEMFSNSLLESHDAHLALALTGADYHSTLPLDEQLEKMTDGNVLNEKHNSALFLVQQELNEVVKMLKKP